MRNKLKEALQFTVPLYSELKDLERIWFLEYLRSKDAKKWTISAGTELETALAPAIAMFDVLGEIEQAWFIEYLRSREDKKWNLDNIDEELP